MESIFKKQNIQNVVANRMWQMVRREKQLTNLWCSGLGYQLSGIKKGAGVEKGKTQENLKFLDSVSSLEPACFWKKKKSRGGGQIHTVRT